MDPLLVECPVCHAPAKQDCTGVVTVPGATGYEIRYQHWERFRAAELTPEELRRAIR